MQRRDFLKSGAGAGGAALSAPVIGRLFQSAPASGTFVHCVYFWLRDGLTDSQIASFEEGIASLTTISSVRDGFYGTPADTDRPIIERSYGFGLVVVFDDKEGHDAYQIDEVHDAFREKYADFWEEVKIYDFVTG